MSRLLKACLLVGGPSVGTRFRPLSLSCPKPLFPIAGVPMIYHHIAALAKIEGLKEVLLIGFFDNGVFDEFLRDVQRDFPHLSVKYLREYQSLGTGGGLYHFRDEILRGNPEYIFCLHADICSSFPLKEMLDFHIKNNSTGLCTILGTRVQKDSATRYGCLVSSPETAEVLHYVEKPTTFLSDLISCGIYLFSKDVFTFIKKVISDKPAPTSSTDPDDLYYTSTENSDIVRLEQDILRPLAGSKRLFVYTCQPKDFWMQIKSASSSIPANRLYLSHLKTIAPEKFVPAFSTAALTPANSVANLNNTTNLNGAGKSVSSPELVGNVLIHPSAIIHPTAKIGPNVSIGSRVVIGRGVRVRDSIVLDGVAVNNDCFINNAIVGWQSKVGSWARLEGVEEPLSTEDVRTVKGIKVPGATVLAKDVTIREEVAIRSCIVLPNKELKASFYNEILM